MPDGHAFKLPGGGYYDLLGAEEGVLTTFEDGTTQAGVPNYDDPESVARARALGYQGSDRDVVWGMTRDHDLLHSLVAHAIDGGESHALRHSSRGVQEPGRIPLEERLVFLVQRALNVRDIGELVEES